MELVDYHELKREAYLMAIKQLEEEHNEDINILKKLQELKIKYATKKNSNVN